MTKTERHFNWSPRLFTKSKNVSAVDNVMVISVYVWRKYKLFGICYPSNSYATVRIHHFSTLLKGNAIIISRFKLFHLTYTSSVSYTFVSALQLVGNLLKKYPFL